MVKTLSKKSKISSKPKKSFVNKNFGLGTAAALSITALALGINKISKSKKQGEIEKIKTNKESDNQLVKKINENNERYNTIIKSLQDEILILKQDNVTLQKEITNLHQTQKDIKENIKTRFFWLNRQNKDLHVDQSFDLD
jgi:predicted  nucleic acid-binding Zn-ribbon protein